MANKKQSTLDKLLSKNKPEEELEIEEFMEIGGSPVPGITLRQVLRGHTDQINRIAWSPDGNLLATWARISDEFVVQIWNIKKGTFNILHKEITKAETQTWERAYSVDVTWSSDGKNLATVFSYGGYNRYDTRFKYESTLSIWDTASWNLVRSINGSRITDITWSPDHSTILAIRKMHIGETPKKNLAIIYNAKNGKAKKEISDLNLSNANKIAWSPDGKKIAVESQSHKLSIYSTYNYRYRLEIDFGEHESQYPMVWNPKGSMLASTRLDKIINIWDIKTGTLKHSLEGHTGTIHELNFLAGGQVLVSISNNEIRLWNTSSWESTAIDDLEAVICKTPTFHSIFPTFASTGKDNTIYIYDIDYETFVEKKSIKETIQYTTAKIVLVGDSGVGKTGLGWRITHNEFKEHASTHGQQFWMAPDLSNKREDGTECEAVLWDLAGQHLYRSIHSIFLDNVDTSIILFDPTNRQDPLKGAQYWLEQLKGKKKLPPSVLVGARIDRGTSVLSQQELDQFCQKHGISGGYIGTSAKSGEGLNTLIETLKKQIPWDQMTTTITTVTFKRIKEFVLSLKENPDRKGVLVQPSELRKQLESTDKDWQFSDAEMMTAAGHLENHGYISILRNSTGDEFILLAVDLLVNLASSIILEAEKHPKELGAVNETDLLRGRYQFDELKGLEQEEQQILIDAAILRFLEHNICFRQTLENDSLLIFPNHIKQKRPLESNIQSMEGTSYIVRGSIENLYARMVVLLGYTHSHTRLNQWQNQAQYTTQEGHICSFKLIEDNEGEIEFVLQYSKNMPEEERNDFQELFEHFLYQHKVDVTAYPSVLCPNGHIQERATVIKRLRDGKETVHCYECGEKTRLPIPAEQKAFAFEAPDWLKRDEATARLRGIYEEQISVVKSYRREWAAPRCYISFSPEDKEFATKLKYDLSEAGIFIIDNPVKTKDNDNIIIINSNSYDKALGNNELSDDRKLIQSHSKNNGKGLITIKQSGITGKHDISHCQPDSFSEPTHHMVNLFDLVLFLYAIPLDQVGFKKKRLVLHQQWEQTLAKETRTKNSDLTSPDNSKEIFISYAWGGESEKLVNELDQAIQDRGISLIRDKYYLNYTDSIKSFMERIGKGKGIVVVISEKYLKSKNCMFELTQIASNQDFRDRIFPIVLSDANIYDSNKKAEYYKYWENRVSEQEATMRSMDSLANQHGLREDLDLFDNIRDEIGKLIDVIQDMNALTPEMHRDSNFEVLFNAVTAKLEE